MAKFLLPKPDEFRNYWLAAIREAPAIMRSKRLRPNEDTAQNDVIDNGYFFATTSDGPICDGRGLRQFKTPNEALAAINAAAF